jgi:hypothetical protein
MKPSRRGTAGTGRAGTAVGRYRARMRSQGLRLVQFWAPDVGAEGFAAECRRQSAQAARAGRQERELLRDIGALAADLDLGDVPETARAAGRARR